VLIAAHILAALLGLCVTGWLAVAAGWPRSSDAERLALSLPAAMALVAVGAALIAPFGLGLNWAYVLALDAVLLATLRGRRPRRPRVRIQHLGPALAGAVLVVAWLVSQGGITTPPGDDMRVHAEGIRWLLEGQAVPPMLPRHLSAVAVPEVRYGWYVVAALLTGGTGMPADQSAAVAILPLLLWLPVSLAAYARRLTGDAAVALVAGTLAAGVGVVPFRPLGLGQAPLMAGYVLTPAAALAVHAALRYPRPRALILAVAFTAGMVLVHLSDIPTFALLLAALLLAQGLSWRRVTGALGFAAAASALGLLALRYPSALLPGPVIGGLSDSSTDSARLLVANPLGTALPALYDLAATNNLFVLPFLALFGLYTARSRRPAVVVAGVGILLFLVFLDAWVWHMPTAVFLRFVPWSDPERLAYLVCWFVLPVLGGYGAVKIAAEVGRRQPRLGNLGALTMLAAMGALSVLPFAAAYAAVARNATVGLVAEDRVAFTTRLASVPHADLILTDGSSDGGAWISVLTVHATLLDEAWQDSTAAPRVRAALRALCTAGTGARLRELQVRWVYLGAHPLPGALADRSCLSGTSELRRADGGSSLPALLEVMP
jgi:hypothetical protein